MHLSCCLLMQSWSVYAPSESTLLWGDVGRVFRPVVNYRLYSPGDSELHTAQPTYPSVSRCLRGRAVGGERERCVAWAELWVLAEWVEERPQAWEQVCVCVWFWEQQLVLMLRSLNSFSSCLTVRGPGESSVMYTGNTLDKITHINIQYRYLCVWVQTVLQQEMSWKVMCAIFNIKMLSLITVI